MQVLTAVEMADVDRRTAAEFGVPFSALMEAAGTAVARFCLRRYPAAKRVAVLCGKGNNGGDGFVAARVLARAGIAVRVLLAGRVLEVKGEAAVALQRMREGATSVIFDEASDEAVLCDWCRAHADVDLLVDAIVGTGFKPPLRGLPLVLRELVAVSKIPVVAVDLPSGWDADSIDQKAPCAFRADAVVTFTAPKLAHVFGHLTRSTFGPVVVAEIGSPPEAIASEGKLSWTGSSKAIAEAPRNVNANKGKFGHVLVVGGSYGTSGAPSMASLAALRTGAGLVTAAVPKSILDAVAHVAPELMLFPLLETSDGTASMENFSGSVRQPGFEGMIRSKRISVVAVGPGLSTSIEAGKFAQRLVERGAVDKDGKPLPIVIDADALNAFASHAELLNGAGRIMVLTPHPGEMARLVGTTVPEVEADRIGLARRFATEHKLTLVLKGWRTLVAHPDGRIAVNTSGNPAMAKGGSGDILTGIVAAMLAQYARSGEPDDVARAVEAAVYLHGLAADFAAIAQDEHAVLATDTLAHLSDAFRYRVKDADGFTWLCGLNNVEAKA
jgi:ADP-dependent NAD(P)H-hydrate dehydratase / NAD(P)H-hydrate epimerase